MFPKKARLREGETEYLVLAVYPQNNGEMLLKTGPITEKLFSFDEVVFITDWIACCAQLPKPSEDRVKVLYSDFTTEIVGAEFLRIHWFGYRITHWMPLPEAPEV